MPCFKNNFDYKEGRGVRSSHTRRAMAAGSRFGREAAEQAWRSAESNALHMLHAHGVRVPEPILFYEGVLLMQLVTDPEGRPAPRLIDTHGAPETARELFVDLRTQIVRMLCCELIHGDLSPYNILAGHGGPTIIDFPQIVSAPHSSRSEYFFQRDFHTQLKKTQPSRYYLNEGREEASLLMYELQFKNRSITILESYNMMFLMVKPNGYQANNGVDKMDVLRLLLDWTKIQSDQKHQIVRPESEIIKALEAQDVNIEKRQLIIEKAADALGIYEIGAKLHPEVTAKIRLWVTKK